MRNKRQKTYPQGGPSVLCRGAIHCAQNFGFRFVRANRRLTPTGFDMRKRDKGFTFIELIMVIVIVGIAIIPLIQMFTTSLKGSADAEATSIALELAQDKMDETKQLSFAATASTSGSFASPFTAYSYQVTVSYVDQNFTASVPATNYKKVAVKVTHSSGTGTTLTTVVSNHS